MFRVFDPKKASSQDCNLLRHKYGDVLLKRLVVLHHCLFNSIAILVQSAILDLVGEISQPIDVLPSKLVVFTVAIKMVGVSKGDRRSRRTTPFTFFCMTLEKH